MSVFSSIGHFLGNLVGGDDDEKKKKKQQQDAAAAQAARKSNAPTKQQVEQKIEADPQQPSKYLTQVKQVKNQFGNNIDASLLKKANPATTTTTTQPPTKLPSDAEILARSAGAVGTNVAGGIIGAVKGIAELPSFVLNAPKLVRTGAAKLTKNKVAEENIKNDQGTLTKLAARYDEFAKPTTDLLTKAEAKTDAAGERVAPWQPGYAKNTAKAVTNLVPVDAAIGAVSGLSKAGKLSKVSKTEVLAKDAEAALTPPVKAPTEIEAGIRSANPNHADDAIEQVAAATPPPPPAPIPEETGAHIMSTPEQETLKTLTTKAKTQVLQPEEQKVQQLLQAKQDLITESNAPPKPVIEAPVEQPKPVVPDKKLPRELAGAKPRYNYGSKQYELKFADDVAKSLYVVAGKNPSRSDEAYMAFLRQHFPGESDAALRKRGSDVRDVIKKQAAAGKGGETLKVEDHPSAQTPVDAAAAIPTTNEPAVTVETNAAPAATEATIPESVTAAPAPVNSPAPTVTPAPVETAPNAPNIQAALEKFADTPAQGGTHEVLNIAEGRAQATRNVAAIGDDELIAAHKDGIVVPSSPQRVFDSVESIKRLEKLKDNPEAATAISNLIDGIAEFESKAGQGLSVANAILEDMPVTMKVNVLLKKIDKLRTAADNEAKFPPIRENKKLEAEVMGNLKQLLEDNEAMRGQIAKTEAAIEKINADPAAALTKYGDRAGVTKQLDTLDKRLTNESLAAQAQNGETIRYYDTLVPGKGKVARAADWARTTMLTAPTGRLNDVFTTGGNVLRESIQSVVQAGMGKVVNKVKGSGSVIDSTLLRKGTVRGTKAGASAAKREFKGDLLAPDLGSAIKTTSMGGKGGLRRAPATGPLNKVKNLTHAATNFATNLSEGVKRGQLERLARQEGQKAGLTGDELKVYTHGRSLVPSRHMEAKAQELKEQINNLNDNPWSKKVAKFTSSEGSDAGKGYGALIQNMVVPFPKYMTTFAWNSITDKNVIAQGVKALRAAKKGDTDELLKHIAGAVTDGSGVAMGYWLTQHGVITNKNAQGYNDDGAYLHLGNRYIPVGFLGFAGGSIIAGNAIHSAVNGTGNVLDKAAKIIGDTVTNTVRMTGTQSLIGGDNPTVKALQSQFGGNEDTKTGDTAAVIGGQAVGQFIPGMFGDINAVLNMTPLNKTHEAANTKVISSGKTPTGRPSKAKDVPRSTVKSLENRIPGVSQTLPRKTGVAAPDLIDRTTRGDHETSAQLLVKAKAKTAEEIDAADTKAGIPNPNGAYDKGDTFESAVENRIENKKYDQAIAGLQQKLDGVKAGKNVTEKQTKPLEKQIATAKVLKAGNYDPKIRDEYSGTGVDEWRAMGDPENDNYDPKKYQELFAYEDALVKAGAVEENKYKVKSTKSGSGGKSKLPSTSNTLGSTPDMKRLDLSSLTPRKITDASIPKIAPLLSSDLIKARKISVSKA